MDTKINIKTLLEWCEETKEQRTKIIMGGRRSGKTGIQTVTLINSLPIPQSEKDRLIKIYFDEFRIMNHKENINEL